MEDLERTLTPESNDAAAARTARLPRITTERDFRVGQSRILEMVAANAPLDKILEQLVLLIESQSQGMLCSVLLLSDDGDHVRHGAAPNLPDEYVRTIDGAPIGPKNGSCGTAMYRGEPVIVRDVWVDPLWEDYRGLAHACGLRACWSTPIMSGRGKVLGSFAMYYREPRLPTEAETRLTDIATRIAAVAIEHKLAREILARTQAALSRATESANTGEFVLSAADEINRQLEGIVQKADKGVELLNEDPPDFVQLRDTFKTISRNAEDALQFTSKIRRTENK